jgi:integrase
MRGDGRVYQRGQVFWISYYHHGKNYRERGGVTAAEARRRLRVRLKEIHGERFVGLQEERLTVGELLDALKVHLENRGTRSMAQLEGRKGTPFLSHLKVARQSFGFLRAIDVSTARVERFQKERLAAKKSRATVNREVGVLKQAFNLARKQGRLGRVPYFPMLKEDNARQGFFERGEFEAVVANLSESLDDVARFAYLTGWRRGEVLPLRWDSVDRSAREVRLRTSKNGRGRVVPLDGSLWELIERRWAAREFRTAGGGSGLSAFVFHRSGEPIRDFRKSWEAACTAAEVPGKLFHDLRRTAVRNMVRAGVPQAVAMSISGHRTVSMFLRYNISSEEDKRAALLRTEAYLESQPSTSNVLPLHGEQGQFRDKSGVSGR